MVLVKQRGWFPTAKKDAVGRACIPGELKVGKINDRKKWPKLCCVDDILPTAVVVLRLLYSVALVFKNKSQHICVVSNEDDSHNVSSRSFC